MRICLSRRPFFAAIVAASASGFACNGAPDPPPCDAGEVADLTIVTLQSGEQIRVGDHTLSDWPDSPVLLTIDSNEANTPQLETIPLYLGDRTAYERPQPLSADDLRMQVRMAATGDAWYIGFEVTDDSVVPASLTDRHHDVYSGDSLEIFFAAARFDDDVDYSNHVGDAKNPGPHAGGFFQLAFPPRPLEDGRGYFQAHRTHQSLIDRALDYGFAVDIWSANESVWSGEARLPLEALDPVVRNCVNGRNRVRLAVDFLDYDRGGVTAACGQNGYCPHNVFGPARGYRQLTYPREMPTAMLN